MKTDRVTIRLSEDDLRIIQKAADYSKLSMSSYIRMVVLQDAEKRVNFYERIRK